MLKQRVITALILAPIVILAIVYMPPVYLRVLFGLFLLVGLWEWSRLAGLQSEVKCLGYVTVGALAAIMLGYVHAQYGNARILGTIGLGWWLLLALLLATYPLKEARPGRYARINLLIGFVTLCLAWLALIELHIRGPLYLLYLFCLVALADITAYFVGRAIGRRRLAPTLSPGKTWEGAIGGLLAVLLAAAAMVYPFGLERHAAVFIFISLLSVIFSIVGDLFESLLKRQAGVKDSGKLLPGHGGLLDRIDSVLAAAPVFLVGSIWFIS